MPRQGQIIPEYLVPHVKTYINDNSIFEDATAADTDEGIRLLSVFASPKGRDKVALTFNNPASFIEEFGTPNFALYGQPMYNAYAALQSGNAIVHCMRVMPDDATYSNLVIIAEVTQNDDAQKIEVKFTSKAIPDITDGDTFAMVAQGLTVDELPPLPDVTPPNPVENLDGTEEDLEDAGTTDTPAADRVLKFPIIAVRAKGRGAYGNTLRIRFTSDTLSDQDNQYKNYIAEVLDSDTGLSKKESMSGSLYQDAVISKQSIFFDDVVNDPTNGSAKLEITILSDNLEAIHNLYKDQIQPNEDIEPLTTFDFLNGYTKEGKAIDHYEVVAGSISLDRADGLVLATGNDGSFSGVIPTPENTVADLVELYALSADTTEVGSIAYVTGTDEYYELMDATQIGSADGWMLKNYDRQAAIDAEYIKAFGGTDGYDKAIRSKRRTPAELILDANYSEPVKRAMVECALKRYDARCVLDCGILSTATQVIHFLDEIANIDDFIISKETQNYIIRDPFNGKRINVTSTYYIAENLPTHIMTFGSQTPFVGQGYALLSGHVRNSIKPMIDADDLETKEEIYTRRANYFECIAEDTFVRGAQGTSQTVWSDLSEENNVTVLLEMKRMLEDFVSSKLYNFAEAEDRKSFTDSADRMFMDYKSTKVRDYNVYFDMNAFEEERSILHCYLSVTFRTLAKRGIIEIDINKRV